MIDTMKKYARSLAVDAVVVKTLHRNCKSNQGEQEQRIHNETAALKEMHCTRKTFHMILLLHIT